MTAQSRDGKNKRSCNRGRRAKALVLICGKIAMLIYCLQVQPLWKRIQWLFTKTNTDLSRDTWILVWSYISKGIKDWASACACSQIAIASLLTVPNIRNNSGSLNRQMDKQIVVYAYKGKHQSLHVVCPQSDLEGFILWELKSIWNYLKTKWTKQKQANWAFGYSVWVTCVCDKIKWAFPVEEQQSHWGSVRGTSIESESKVPMKLS